MYSEEVKDKILHLLKYKTIKEIAEEFGISYSTLYRWQKTKNDSKLIKELMLEEKYDEALVIGKSYPNNEVIKGQVMSIYMKKRDYEKAIQIAREFPNNASIQSQLMTVYVKNKDYEAAIKIAEKFSSYAPIQSQLMTVYMKNKDYEAAIKIAREFPNNAPIQSQLMTVYVKNKDYEAAIKIAEKFSSYAPIQSQLMTVYMKNKDYEAAIKIAREFPNNAPIQSQLMTVYVKNKDYEAAIKIAEKFPNDVPIQSQLITVYMENKNYGSARKIAAKFPNDNIIQSQLMTAYVKNGDYEGAREIAAKFPNDNIIQSQLMTVYMENKNYESAREIAEKFPNDNIIQSQLMTVYMENGDYESARKIAAKFLNDNIIKRQLMKIHMENEIKESPEEISDWYNEIIKTKKQEFPIKILEIRNKIVVDNISVKDLDTLESFKEKLEEEKYLLIKLAMYEKLGLLNLGMKQLKQNTIFSDKLKKQLLMQFERKSKFYNLGNWDSLIGWFDETKPLEKVQEACVKENDVASGNPSTSIPEVQSKNIKPSSIQKTIPKKQNNPKSIFKTNIGVTNTVPSKVKEEQKKPTKIKNNQGPKTLYDTLDQTYKKMILNLKIKYYKDMHDEEKKQSALYKYDRLEESLSSKPSIKNFDILLLMLIGDGDGSLDIEQSIPKEYNGEYKKVLNKINSRRKH